MNPFDAKPGLFDISLRMFGMSLRIKPSYWIFTAVFGYMLGNHDLPSLGAWVVACAITTVVHQLGQLVTGRLFGYPGAVVLAFMGGGLIAEHDRAPRWQRIVISAASILASVLFFGLLYVLQPTAISHLPPNNMQWFFFLFSLYQDLMFKSLLDIVLSGLPILPDAGGKIATDVIGYAVGRRDYVCGLVLSIITAAGVSAYSLYKWYHPDLPYFENIARAVFPTNFRPPNGGQLPAVFMAVMFGITAIFLILQLISLRRKRG